MIDDAAQGEIIFYNIYSDQEKRDDESKDATGLFYFRGRKEAPFAVICPGGGFSYVGSVHEGFPYAMELSKKGYNAFVLRYRVGGGGTPATMDLAAALSFIFTHSEKLDVETRHYSLWGSSAGARMVAYIGSLGTLQFWGDALPPPSAIIMAYTAHSDFTARLRALLHILSGPYEANVMAASAFASGRGQRIRRETNSQYLSPPRPCANDSEASESTRRTPTQSRLRQTDLQEAKYRGALSLLA